MICCINPRKIDFSKFVEFPDLKDFGIKKWPVSCYKDNRKELIMVHAPVGTDSIFKGSVRYKIAISGFATSLPACKRYLKNKFILSETNNMAEIKHTFNSGRALRTNLLKIFKGVKISDKYKFVDLTFEELLELIKKQPFQYPFLMTQALCCIGTEKQSNADEIIKRILKSKLPLEFKNMVENSLKTWVHKLVKQKEKNSILCLLGFRKSRKSAIRELVDNIAVGKDGNVHINDYSGQSLFEYLKAVFDNKVFFLPHPVQLKDEILNGYLKTNEYAKLSKALKTLK